MKARDYEEKIKKMRYSNPHPSRTDYVDGIISGLQVALGCFPLPEQIYIPKPDFGFAEWVGPHYVRLNGYWVRKYADQRNKDNYLSSEKLYKLYKDLK